MASKYLVNSVRENLVRGVAEDWPRIAEITRSAAPRDSISTATHTTWKMLNTLHPVTISSGNSSTGCSDQSVAGTLYAR